MKKRKGAIYKLTIHASAQTVREAVKKKVFISATLAQEEHKELADVHAVEFDPPEWSDEEEIPPEMGFKAPQKGLQKPRRRKKR